MFQPPVFPLRGFLVVLGVSSTLNELAYIQKLSKCYVLYITACNLVVIFGHYSVSGNTQNLKYNYCDMQTLVGIAQH